MPCLPIARGCKTNGKTEVTKLRGVLRRFYSAGLDLVVVQPQAQAWGDLLPADFDWQAYVSYHPRLRDVGIATEAHAREHYATAGRHQKLVYRKLRVTMRYTACTGEQRHGHAECLVKSGNAAGIVVSGWFRLPFQLLDV